jgi:hypothetical protein
MIHRPIRVQSRRLPLFFLAGIDMLMMSSGKGRP